MKELRPTAPRKSATRAMPNVSGIAEVACSALKPSPEHVDRWIEFWRQHEAAERRKLGELEMALAAIAAPRA